MPWPLYFFQNLMAAADECGVTTPSSDQRRSATVQVPSPAGDGKKLSIPCIFSGMEGRRLSVEANETITVSTAVSVECDDTLFLGEVVTCSPADEGWKVEIKVEQILTGLQSLMALRAHLLSEGVPQSLRLIPAGASN
jgi:hypothetical protein